MKSLTSSDFLASILADDEPLTDADATAPDVTLAFEIKRFVLQQLLEKSATTVPSRDVMPVLKNYWVELDADRIKVVATDLELSMIATTRLVTVTKPGTAVLPAKKLLGIVKAAEEETCHIRVAGTAATITIGRASWTLRLASGHDYPAMPDIAESAFTTIDKGDFAAALNAVRYAACRDANRSSLTMINIEGGKMTACDGSRFAQATVDTIPGTLRIPIGAVDDLVRLLKLTDLTRISIGESANHIIFRFGLDVFIITKLMAAFPDMEALLLRPAMENRHPLAVDRVRLLAAIKRVRINADTESSAIALGLTFGQLTVSAQDKFGNTAAETIDAEWLGTDRTLVVNHQFLYDLVAGHVPDTVTFKLGDDTRTRKTPVLVADPDAGTVGVLQQMSAEWT